MHPREQRSGDGWEQGTAQCCGAATAFAHTLCIPLLPHSASASCRGCAKPHTLLLLLLLKISKPKEA